MPEATAAATNGAPLRVILVGASPLEQTLRRDAGLELIRARDTLAAVAEVADPIDADSPARTAVILTPESQREADLATFIEAVRAAAPRTHILGIDGERAGQALPLDASLAPDADGDQLRRTLASIETNSASPGPERREAPPNQRHVANGSHSESPEDQSAVEALLSGADPLNACLEAVRRRLGVADVSFAPDGDDAPPRDAAPVARRGARFGWLSAPGASAESLQTEAHWLGAWLGLREQVSQLRDAAFRDSLTGAWNRRYFEYFLPKAIEKAREQRRDVTLMIYDIDDFKTYNDRFGHAAGDEILRETVRLLLSVIRPTDRVCRVGGDEFAVIFDDPRGPRSGVPHQPLSINDIAARFQREVCAHRFPKLSDEAPSTLTISGGLATFPWDGGDAETLLQRADELALESKRQGKNVLTFGPGAERICRIRFDDAGGGREADS